MNEHRNPWTVLAQRVIYENPWIGLTEYDVINPGGGKGIYGKVRFKNLAVGVVPLDKQGYTWLVGQYRFALDAYSWEIPEGGGDPGVAPIESARRELMKMHLSNSVSDEKAYVFLAQGLEQKEAQPEETEQLVVRRLSFDEALRMVENGEITDSISVAAILKVKLMLLQGQLSFT